MLVVNETVLTQKKLLAPVTVPVRTLLLSLCP